MNSEQQSHQPPSDLRALLASIPELPWSLGTSFEEPGRIGIYTGKGFEQQVIALVEADDSEAFDSDAQDEAKAKAQYLTRAANVLPKLLQAAEGALPFLADHVALTPTAGPADRIAYDRLESAISEAHGGNVTASMGETATAPASVNAALLAALYKIDANAAESADWIRQVARTAIAAAIEAAKS